MCEFHAPDLTDVWSEEWCRKLSPTTGTSSARLLFAAFLPGDAVLEMVDADSPEDSRSSERAAVALSVSGKERTGAN